MIEGIVNVAREAQLRLRFTGADDREEQVLAVIDTGFNDFLTLPLTLIAKLGLPFEAPTLATLADGSVVTLDYYRATLQWDDKQRTVPVLAVESGPLIGMSMLYGYRLKVDVVDGGKVSIETLP
jgi:clan AA aspartic protease